MIEEHARLEILLPSESDWRELSEDYIISNSLSITQKCMEDSSFSLGGVYSAQLSVKIRVSDPSINTYNIVGAKIKVYSWFENEDEVLRGIFWVTSASCLNGIYTLSASDCLIWLDSSSYSDDGFDTNVIYSLLSSDTGNLGWKFGQIINVVNGVLSESIDALVYTDDSAVTNHCPSDVGYCVLPTEMVGEIATKNPRDYASWLTEIAAGFVYVDYSSGEAEIKIGQFKSDSETEISEDDIQLNNCNISDFTVGFSKVYTGIYDGSSGSVGCTKNANSVGNITIDITENPFVNGHWQYNDGSAMDVLRGIAGAVSKIPVRPFNLRVFCKQYFYLGECITLPDGNNSILTGIKWHFKGGYTLSCAGRDTRVLYASARRSQATKMKDLAYTKTYTEIQKLKKEISDGAIAGLKGDKGDKGDPGKDGADGKDGFSPIVEVFENTDNSYILSITDGNGTFNTPNLKGADGADVTLSYLQCSVYTGFCDNSIIVADIEFQATEENATVQISGDAVISTEEKSTVTAQYFLDDVAELFTPKVTVDGYSTLHLNHVFSVDNGQHNIKAVLTGIANAEQCEAYLIGQNIILVPIVPTSAEDYVYIVEDTVTLLNYIGSDERIQIPDTIENTAVTTIEITCFTYSDVTEVVIPDGVTTIN